MDVDTYLRILGLELIDANFFWQLLEKETDNPAVAEWQKIMNALRWSRDPHDERRLDDFAASTLVPQLGILFSELAARVWSLDKHRKVLPAILEWCRSGHTILEVGCGPGYLLGFLACNLPDHHIVGIDRLESAIACAASNLKTLGITQAILAHADLSELSKQYHNFFDCVVLRDVCGNEFDTTCDWDKYVQRITDFLKAAAQFVNSGGSLWYSLSIGGDPYILEDLGWCIRQAITKAGLVLEKEQSYPYRVFEGDHYHHCWLLSPSS